MNTFEFLLVGLLVGIVAELVLVIGWLRAAANAAGRQTWRQRRQARK